LGDKGKFVALGKERVATFSDDGTISAALQFAAGEGAVTLQGYAPKSPTIIATVGSVGAVTFNATAQRFSVVVTPTGNAAAIKISP
jgi:hypothetical protein